MSKSDVPSLVKNPYTKTKFKNDKELQDFIKCCDPKTGHFYFLDNFCSYIFYYLKNIFIYLYLYKVFLSLFLLM